MITDLLQTDIAPDLDLADHTYFETLRSTEYGRLDRTGNIYFDYTGGNLYAQSQLNKHMAALGEQVYGNPHSTNPTSLLATKLVEETRQSVLDFFHAEDYFCVFTQNASGALQIIGECYPFQDNGHLMLLTDNHNSVNGIREYCQNRGGSFEYTPINYEDLSINTPIWEEKLKGKAGKTNKLLAFPAQSNVSGVKHDLNWVKKAQDQGWDVLLDAAAFVPTSPLDLKAVSPDFVSMSFYKIFGYPTGLGCLLVRKDKFDKLHKPWFAGGTVTLVSVNAPAHFLIRNHERFENGTLNYLDIPAIKIGLDYISNIGMDRISARVKSMTAYLIKALSDIRHNNGNPVIKIFGPLDTEQRGGTLILNFSDADEHLWPFEKVEALANTRKISIRTGCFCNPGIDEVNNCLTTAELSQYFTSRQNGDFRDMMAYLGKMRGAVRISVGFPTNAHDINMLISFVQSFVNQPISQ